MELIVDFSEARRSQATDTAFRSRRVSISEEATVMFVENLVIQHKADLWFSKLEMKSFKYVTAMTLRTIKAANMTIAEYAERNAEDTSLFMGLENYLTNSTSDDIRRRRRAVVEAVLLEQARQTMAHDGICDHEKLAKISEAVTAVDQRRAYIIALIHASNR